MALGELKNGIGPDAYAIYQQVLAAVVERDHTVGSLYISENSTSPAELFGGTWERIEDCTIWGASDTHPAGATVKAGLPNITAKVTSRYGIFNADAEGAFYFVDGANYQYPATGLGGALIHDLHFSAANSNSIYGASNTVQPPAYCLYLWRRVA